MFFGYILILVSVTFKRSPHPYCLQDVLNRCYICLSVASESWPVMSVLCVKWVSFRLWLTGHAVTRRSSCFNYTTPIACTNRLETEKKHLAIHLFRFWVFYFSMTDAVWHLRLPFSYCFIKKYCAQYDDTYMVLHSFLIKWLELKNCSSAANSLVSLDYR